MTIPNCAIHAPSARLNPTHLSRGTLSKILNTPLQHSDRRPS